MVDRAELRRLAEAAKDAWTRVDVDEGFDVGAQADIDALNAFDTAASPDVVLGLLDSIEVLEGWYATASGQRNSAEMERDQLRAVAVRLKRALQELESRVFEDGAPDDVLEETQGILADPKVEKL